MRRSLAAASFAGAALFLLSTCRSTEHTVARIVTPTPGPVEVFEPPPPEPPTPPPPPTSTPAPAVTRAVRTPTITAMPVVTAAPAAERSPGVLYEQYVVPTAVAETSLEEDVVRTVTRTNTPRSRRPERTPTPAPTLKPGVYYEDEKGRPVTPTPQY